MSQHDDGPAERDRPMTEHDEVRELLELAAVEPDGLDRLEAGDTAASSIVVGHLAACPDCLEEMARLRRADTILRPVLASEPDPALRERTLAFVRAVGVARGAGVEPAAPAPGMSDAVTAATTRPVPVAASVPVDPAEPAEAPGPRRAETLDAGARRPRRVVGLPAWIATLAAALVIGLVGGALLAGAGGPGGDGAVALRTVASETAALLAADDARRVALVDASGAPAGTLVSSVSEGRMLVTATGLDQPPPGSEYRCWVEIGGSKRTIGTMRWNDSVAWWTGDVAIPANAPAGVGYGVSLVEKGSSGPGTVVLTGTL